jgi:transposase
VTPLPLRVREEIIRRRADGHTYVEIADQLGVGVATVNRVIRRRRETGRVAPRPNGGGLRSPIHDEIAKALVQLVRKMSDATIAEVTAALVATTGVTTSRSAVVRALHRLGFRFKKKRSPRWSAIRKSIVSDAEKSVSSSSP